MNDEPLTASLESVRRLAVSKQRLAGKLPSRATKEAILTVVRDLAYVQWDPIGIVAPSHILSLWARLGRFRPSDFEELLWEEKRLFEHWTPIASIVLTEDYPLYSSLMRRFPESLSKSWGSQRDQARKFLARNGELRKRMRAELRKGPLALGQFQDHLRTKRSDGEWTPRSDVARMLEYLHMMGEVMVVGHQGSQNLWGRTETFLPSGVDRTELSVDEFERAAARRAIRALGTAAPSEIHYYFVRGRYQNLKGALAQLEDESAIRRVRVEGLPGREERYIDSEDVRLLEAMKTAAWQPRLSLLPPFDNMLGSTARAKRLFGFDYIREQFLPAEKRKYGTYVLPILSGARFIGRIDPRLDRESGTLVVNSVHAEPGAPEDRGTAEKIAETVARLASFLGARRVSYSSRVPAAWKPALR